MRIPISQPSITHAERQAVTDAINAGWISGIGPQIGEFESRMSLLTRRKHVIAVTNGTVALELALRTLGLGVEDEVIVPALTFAAPAAAVLNIGAKLVLVDVHPLTWTLDPEKVKRAITRNTRAIIAVDLCGHPADYDALDEVLGDREDIEIIEDAAQAHGAWYKEFPCGALGDISTFSFYVNKAITTGEGGLLATNSRLIAEQARLIANHGMSPERPYWHTIAGTNFRMTSLTAAIGIAQAQRFKELIGARLDVMHYYYKRLPIPLHMRYEAAWARMSCWLTAVTIDATRRAGVLRFLRDREIDARAMWPALVDLPPFKAYGNGRQQDSFKVAREVSASAFWLPTWAGMPEAIMDEVIEALKMSIMEARPV